MNTFDLNSSFKDPVSECSHIVGQSFNIWIWKGDDTIQAIRGVLNLGSFIFKGQKESLKKCTEWWNKHKKVMRFIFYNMQFSNIGSEGSNPTSKVYKLVS